MSNEIEIFKNEDFGVVRTILDGDTLLFCGSDVARALGYAIPSKAVNTHCKGVSKMEAPSPGGTQTMLFITEGDVYRLIVRSKLPAAEKFEHWLFDEVVPTIRKTGGYVANDDLFLDTYIPYADEETKAAFRMTLSMIRAANAEKAKLQQTVAVQGQQIMEMQPKVSYYEVVLQCKDLLPITTIAKDYGWSGKYMNQYLHEAGVQYKQGKIWLLYQKYAEMGYTNTKTNTYLDNNGVEHTSVNTYWTQKGRLFLYDLLKSGGILPLIERPEENAAS